MTLAGLLAKAAHYHAALARHSQYVLRYCRERVEDDVQR
jgi:hypothetical protein